jgi:hypothetical protein
MASELQKIPLPEVASSLEGEFIFTKLELQNSTCDHIYLFIEFDTSHPVGDKSDFPIGRVTLMREDLPTTPLYTAECKSTLSFKGLVTSMGCYNREIEWNYAYFKKIRYCFTTP